MRAYLRRFAGSERELLLITGLSMVNGLLPAAAVFCIKTVFDGVAADEPVDAALAGLTLVAVLTPTLHVARSFRSRRLAWRLVHDLRMQLHARFHAPDVEPSAGQRLAALTVECEELQYGVSAIVTLLRAPLAIASLVATLLFLSPTLTLRSLLVVPVFAAVVVGGGRWVRRAASAWRDDRAALIEELTDQHNGRETTLDLGVVSHQVARAASFSTRERERRITLDAFRTLPPALLQSAVLLTVVVLVASAVPEVRGGTLTTGGLLAFTAALALLRDPVVRLAEVHTLLARSTAALERVLSVVERPLPPKRSRAERFAVAVDLPGRLEASVVVPAGQKVALVGPSGAGKSTLLDALFGGVGTGEGPPVVRCRQEPWVFARTLRENLDLGRGIPETDRVRILDALGLSTLEGRLDTEVGEQGANLSGGERQRLALARALVGEGALLLDESTSEVEPPRAHAIAKVLASLDRTVVFATHEPHFPEVADRVLFLSEGQVLLDGPHVELMQDERYADLWRRA